MNIKSLANVMTIANLFCGFLSILSAYRGQNVFAAWLIIIALGFDIMDGYIARSYKITSNLGKELDSFSDLVSFGVAASVLVYTVTDLLSGIVLIVLSTYLFSGAFRLARFNVSSLTKKSGFFEGLPIPAAGGAIASTFLVLKRVNLTFNPYLLLGLMLILSFLMVSKIKYPAFKKLQILKLKYLIGFTVVLAPLILAPALIACLFFLIYVIFSPLIFKLKTSYKDQDV